MTFEELKRANQSIKSTDIGKGKEYAEVNQRIKAFRMLMPTGTIETELVSLLDGICIFRASVKDEEGRLLGTGTAYEKEGSSFINKTSFIENCETSAVGRALAMCGFGIDLSVASYEEVANAQLNQKGDKEEVLPIIKDAEEIKPTAKPVEEVKPQMPKREEMLKIALKHYPNGSKNQQALCTSFKLNSLEDATDVQLLALYNKFGGK